MVRSFPFSTLLISMCALVVHAQTRKEVSSLPGFGTPPTKHYTGFVPVDEKTGTHLFYYLVESASSPATDPLVWWHNGGPGASSFAGLIGENGPLLLNSNGTSLFRNPYSWNAHANVLYVEFGPGIGYSYCANSVTQAGCNQSSPTCSPCNASDSSVATQNVALLKALLQGTDAAPALFPALKGRPLFLAGESYAGVYIPTLAFALLEEFTDTSTVNLQGLWVTDPCTDNDAQFGWLNIGVEFAYQKGMIDYSVFTALTSFTCTSGRTKVGDRVRATKDPACQKAWRVYDLATAGTGDAVHPANIPGLPLYIDPLNALGPSGGPDLEGYFNRPEVRTALGADSSPNKVYHMGLGNNGYDQYHLEYAACNDKADDTMTSMVEVYRAIIDAARSNTMGGSATNLRSILISSGDIDPVVNLHGTEAAVKKIGLELKAGGDRRPWFAVSSATDLDTLRVKPTAWGPGLHASQQAGVQMGGYVSTFDAGKEELSFEFLTMRDSGHMVPAYAPQRALHVLEKVLLQGKDLSPLLPSDFATSSDSAFYGRSSKHSKVGIFANWVLSAMQQQKKEL